MKYQISNTQANVWRGAGLSENGNEIETYFE